MKILHLKILFLVCVFIVPVVSADEMKTGNAGKSAHDGNAVIMARTSGEGTSCIAPVPVLFESVPGDGQITITWSDEHTGNQSVTGYNIYYDRDGKSEPVTSVWRQTRYTCPGLTNGQEYCFKVTALHAECESGFSNVLCAVPSAQNPQK